MIVLGASGAKAEVPFRLLDATTGAAITGKVWTDVGAGLTNELLVNLPASGAFANTTIANIIEKGRGFYALRLTSGQTATAGAVYIDHAVAAASAYAWQESIIDQADIAAAVLAAAYEGALTVQGLLRLTRSILINKASGLEGAAVAFRDAADTKNRVSFALSGGAGKDARVPTIDET